MTYNAHPRYRIFALVSLLLTGFFAWDLLDGFEPAIGLFEQLPDFVDGFLHGLIGHFVLLWIEG